MKSKDYNIMMSSTNIKKHNLRNDSVLNFNRILKLLIRYWFLFLISLPLALVVVYIYHLNTVTVYQASATLLFKSADNNSLGGSNLIEGFGLSPEVRNIENQTFILRSFKVVRKAVENIDFGIEYFSEGLFNDSELYTDAPFRVMLDSTQNQLINVPVQLHFLQNGNINVKLFCESGVLYDVINEKYVGAVGIIDFEKEIKWNEWIKTPFGTLKIIKSGGSPLHELTYYYKVRSIDDVANEFRSRLGISSMGDGSSIVFLRVTGTSSGKIRTFLDRLCKVVIDYNLEQKNEIATRSINFIQSQLNMISDTLDRTQAQLLSFRKENRFLDPSSASEQLANQYYAAEKEIKMIELNRDYFIFLRNKLEDNPYGTDFLLPAFSDNNHQIVSQLVMELLELNNELEVYKESADRVNPYMSNLHQKIDVTKSNLMLAIDKMLENLSLEENVLRKQIDQIDKKMSELPVLEKKYLQIDRSYKLNDAIYTFLLQKNSETQITKASNTPDNEIIDKASILGVVSPIKKSNYSKAFMLGLVIPAVIIAIIEFLNVKIRGKEDLDNLVPDVPVLGIIPHSKMNIPNVVLSIPHSVISESFRSIRTRLNFLAPHQKSKVICVTSTNTGDGKTFVAVNLASVFAISGKKTILLGFDLRKPRLSEHFQMINAKGISNVLIGEVELSEACYSGGHDNLCIMPAGEVPPNPTELIESDATKELFKKLRQIYDVIVVDSPPVGVVADARLLMSHTDIHLYVTRYNHTHKVHLQQTIQNLQEENFNSLGLLFNDVQSYVDGYGHYYTEYYGKTVDN
ncbi:MAG: polysaccharide biosynthesis tyrosine autokinase [Marinilabiliaceae bacterium]|nr:polysaccharide biosynthesis tyrosine autokinase [Marinilabiliaceae bacterium]